MPPQDALFQLDPAGSAAAASRPDRDLVDLINRLRDQHPHSLLAPALHVLRTLGNTAVHLDRESQVGQRQGVRDRQICIFVDKPLVHRRPCLPSMQRSTWGERRFVSLLTVSLLRPAQCARTPKTPPCSG